MASATNAFIGPPGELTVFNAHMTPRLQRDRFVETIDWISERFEWLPAGEIPNFLARGHEVAQRPLAALSFDDGYEDNLWSAQHLESRGISAVYF